MAATTKPLSSMAGSSTSAQKSTKIRVNPTYMLKGWQLQVPLYRRLVGDQGRVELIGIHPELEPDDIRAALSYAAEHLASEKIYKVA